MNLGRRNYLNYLGVTFFYLIPAWFNLGYYNPDEHFQLIEFAGLKLGWNSPEDLTWEYASMIRPSLQPYICVVIFKFLRLFNIFDPYVSTFALRVVTAIFSVFCIAFFISNTKDFISKKYCNVYFLLSYFLWIVPFVSVRYTSETWSGLFFLLVVSLIYRKAKFKNYILIGVFSGLSFLFRFQSGILITGLFTWLLFVRRERILLILLCFTFLILTIGFGVFLDFIFYGKYPLAFLNYFAVNILEGVASNYGVEPWTKVLDYFILYPILPIGIVIFSSVIIVIIWQPKNLILWCILPFIIVHSIIPHKEVRFFFPIVWFVPFLVIIAFQSLNSYICQFDQKINRLKNIIVMVIVAVFAITNSFALAVILFRPAGEGEKRLSYFIDRNFGGKPIKLLHTEYDNPYGPYGLKEKFYTDPNVSSTVIYGPRKIQNLKLEADTTYFLVVSENETYKYLLKDFYETLQFSEEIRAIPKWIFYTTSMYPYINPNNNRILYRLYDKPIINP